MNQSLASHEWRGESPVHDRIKELEAELSVAWETAHKATERGMNFEREVAELRLELSEVRGAAMSMAMEATPLAELRRDAERFRWLRDKSKDHYDTRPATGSSAFGRGIKVSYEFNGGARTSIAFIHGEFLESAVDEAMKEETK